jgi:glycerophosphoryl diester phosphodiesterase
MQSLLDRVYQGRTLVLGHRGSSAYTPMNTLPAFEMAVEQGADGIELDVWLSKDGEAVICHDATVDGTTDGSGYIWDKTLAELKLLHAGNKFAASYPTAQIPTLTEVFNAVGDVLFINIEIKADPTMKRGVEQVVADLIKRHHMQERVIVSSFSGEVLRNFRAIAPEIPIGFLHMAKEPASAREMSLIHDLPHEADHPHHLEITPEYVAQQKALGHRINIWTLDDPVRAKELAAMGVDAIITNKPDVILEALRG